MAIKPDADKYFVNFEKERDIARRLDEAFDITFRNSFGGLSFWLADPHQQSRERFGLEKEILVIYSQYIKTDARVLTTIENITRSPDFKHRVERVLFLLVHNGSAIDAEAIANSSVDRIIVSFQVSELLDTQKGAFFIRSKIAKSIGSIDLFGMSSPITSDKHFFGRNELVQALINRTTFNKQCSGLFGLRKTGKTSVLRAIQRRIDDRPVLTEYIECSNPGIHSARWWQVLENITRRCAHNLKLAKNITVRLSGDYTPSNAGTKFASDIKSLLKEAALEQIILMLDEVEFITHGVSGSLGQHWDKDFVPFWQTIRSIHQETQGKLVFFVVGVNPVSVEKSHFDGVPNPIFQLATPYYLEPFTVEKVREMVRSIGKYTGIQFEEPVYQYLQSTYGGHPFLIRIACSELWKSLDLLSPNKTVTVRVSDFAAIQGQIKSRLSSPIKDILLSLVWWYPDEYDLLCVLASGDDEFVESYIEQENSAVFQIAKYGLVKKDNPTDFAIIDLREFLNIYGNSYKQELSPFSRSDMPPALLPEVPDLQVLGRLFERRSDIEIKLRKVIMMYLNVKFSFDSQKISQSISTSLPILRDRAAPKDLFVGRLPQDVMNQLYVPDLKAVILKNWDIFAPLFDNKKDRFEMNLDTLNKARRVEAHTKPVSDIEIEEFENSYTWLYSRLSKTNF
ncbi:MAG: AAA-like domain-containing protein [Methylococcales bacterium]|nr:AAA-like domain-containing protein [Methylococcales bacterium]